jgi:single-strand DNA-binding protein
VDHNRFHAIGRLVRPPEYFTPGRKGQEHCTFTLAINRVVPNEDGPAADYIPCSLWGAEARNFYDCRGKGDEVLILGRIRTNFVQQADGERKFFWEVRVETVDYGRRSLKNLRAGNDMVDATTEAVKQLTTEFGG